MSIFNFFKNNSDHIKIINVLDRLLQISIDGEEINKHRNIDLRLYKILNSPKIHQEVIHIGLYPLVGENKEVSDEYMNFINNLWMYLEYEFNTSYLWAMTSPGLEPDKEKQNRIYNNIIKIRKEIISYLHNKKLISNEELEIELNYNVKKIFE